MLDMLRRATVTHGAQRTIFPLTCPEWHFRGDQKNSARVGELKSAIIREGKVAVAGNYEVQSTIPMVARP